MPHSLRPLRLLCTLMLCFLSAWEAWAQTDQVFVAVTEKRWVNPNTPFIIAAEDSVIGRNMRGLYALTTTKVDGNMLGMRCGDIGDSELAGGLLDKMLWRIESTDDTHIRLRSYIKGNYLYAPASTTLALNADASEALTWEWQLQSDGSLYLRATDGRYLGFNHHAEIDSGYYKQVKPSSTSVIRLRLFCPQSGHAGSAIGEANMQTDGTRLTLRQGNSLIAPHANGGVATYPTTDYLSRQGIVANDGSIRPWTFVQKGDNRFSLLVNDNEGLDYTLRHSSTPAEWTLREGFITTCETPARYLVYANGQLALARVEEGEDVPAAAVLDFAPLGQEADTLLTPTGLKRLTGAWSAERLAALDWTATYALDLCAAELPLRLQPFRLQPQGGNTIFYIRDTDAASLEQVSGILVGCKQTPARILRGGTLHDKQPLLIDRNIELEEGALTYERRFLRDGGWETLCLPFALRLPQGLNAERLDRWEEDALRFAPISEIPAHTPVIVCDTRSETNSSPTTLQAQAGIIRPYTEWTSSLAGNYHWMEVGATTTANVFLLNAEGTAFVRAATGSRLAPFRAYLVSTGSQPLQLRHETDGITTPAMPAAGPAAVYTLDGRRLSPTHGPLKAGLYIRNGRKVLVH